MTGEGWDGSRRTLVGRGDGEKWANVNEKDRWDIGVERKTRKEGQLARFLS